MQLFCDLTVRDTEKTEDTKFVEHKTYYPPTDISFSIRVMMAKLMNLFGKYPTLRETRQYIVIHIVYQKNVKWKNCIGILLGLNILAVIELQTEC